MDSTRKRFARKLLMCVIFLYMKKIIMVALMVGVSLSLSACQSDQLTKEDDNESQMVTIETEMSGEMVVPESFVKYENAEKGLSIAYPDDWRMQENVMGTVVMFLSPTESETDTFSENVNVVTQDLSKSPMSLDDYTDLNLQQLGTVISDFKLIESGATTMDGMKATYVVYSGTQGVNDLMFRQVWAIDNNDMAYVLTFSAMVDKYESVLPMSDQMFETFKRM